jgi:hypothetical protein
MRRSRAMEGKLKKDFKGLFVVLFYGIFKGVRANLLSIFLVCGKIYESMDSINSDA